MRTDVLEKHFNKMGASIEFEDKAARRRASRIRRNPPAPRIDVIPRGKTESFLLDVFDEDVDVQVLDVQPDLRHLLLMFREKNERGQYDISKFLCGHDERHWFVAAVPEEAAAKNVADAMASLKPQIVIQSQKRKGVRRKNINKRKNKGYVRQGEWFFVPAPELQTDRNTVIYKNEPINRGASMKPHICEEVVRQGGTLVYVERQFAPNGITESEYKKLIASKPEATSGFHHWTSMVRDAEVYARGYIKHPDHKTVYLDGWHRVLMNTESKARAMRMVAFLD
jgi:hypothetical protein